MLLVAGTWSDMTRPADSAKGLTADGTAAIKRTGWQGETERSGIGLRRNRRASAAGKWRIGLGDWHIN